MAGTVIRLDARTGDAELVRQARQGDRGALEALFRRHAGQAQGVAFRLLGRDSDLEDVVHEAFMTAFARLDRLDQGESFGPWLATIVTGKAIDTIRRRRVLARLGLLGLDPVPLELIVSPHAPADIVAELRAVYTLIDRLPTAERVVLVLRRVEQLTLDEIAGRTGWSLATVKRKLTRAEQALQASLEARR
ncbi:MAG: RNA polymerase sigma factor [Myxococcales bacterium]|nr:MAG: RNA polymerase sigma factor [Myxococcales bacterium]